MNRLFALVLALTLVMPGFSQETNKQKDDLHKNFVTPPNAAKPRVWWHWMNGNITKDGIQKDLDWMKRVGIGGFQNFDANLFTPVVVPKKAVFMTPGMERCFQIRY